MTYDIAAGIGGGHVVYDFLRCASVMESPVC